MTEENSVHSKRPIKGHLGHNLALMKTDFISENRDS
jgi:hypothetical protein